MKHKQQKKPILKNKKSKQTSVNQVQPATLAHQTLAGTIIICKRKVNNCQKK